jgi:hypothetical protein
VGVAPVPATETLTLRLCAVVTLEAAGVTVTTGVVGFDEPPPPPLLPDPPPQPPKERNNIVNIATTKKAAGLFLVNNGPPLHPRNGKATFHSAQEWER